MLSITVEAFYKSFLIELYGVDFWTIVFCRFIGWFICELTDFIHSLLSPMPSRSPSLLSFRLSVFCPLVLADHSSLTLSETLVHILHCPFHRGPALVSHNSTGRRHWTGSLPFSNPFNEALWCAQRLLFYLKDTCEIYLVCPGRVSTTGRRERETEKGISIA